MHSPFRIAALVTAAALTTHAGVAAARSTEDVADEAAGKQVHAVYAVPRDGIDRQLDVNGTIANEIASFQSWLQGQTGGAPLRIDTAGNGPDTSFIRLTRTDAAVAAQGARVRDVIEAQLHGAGLNAANKIYAVWYDGGSVHACGGGAYPPALPGNVAAMYLHGRPPGASACDGNPFAAPGGPPGYLQFAMLHEILHTIGIVPSCAPHEVRNGHVSDSPSDLMYAGDQPWTPSVLDIGHDDYFAAPIEGCVDLATSGWLAGPAIRRLRLSPHRFRASWGSTIRYAASRAATITFTISRATSRRRWRRLPGRLNHAAAAGANHLRFTGRLGGRRLGSGRYRLTARARSSAGVTGRASRTPFRIL